MGYTPFNPMAAVSPPPYMSGWGTGYGDGSDPSGIGSMASWGAPTTSMGMAGTSPAGTTSIPAFASPKLGLNMGTANLALSGLSTIGNLWAAFQAQKLARQQFEYTKNVTDTNLANQIKTYNTTLTDRAGNRAKVEGHDAGWAQSYVDANALKRYGT